MSTREIRTFNPQTVCDVCGRTLLRGERAEIYLSGGTRRSVCELCKSRALHEGWVREGTLPTYEGGGEASERRGSFLNRLRQRRDGAATAPPAPEPAAALEGEPERRMRPRVPAARRESEPDGEPGRRFRPRVPAPVREPRHVRAVPSGVEQKILSAVEQFNASEHRRTVAGVARSLGAPAVSVRPSPDRASAVKIAVSWELCWYRYEVDLSDDPPTVASAGQGYELDELSPDERQGNAAADERGSLSLAG
ncbi:MAG: hypothetical protein ACR2IP_01440 [Solirubrobacteraceae bacterium]